MSLPRNAALHLPTLASCVVVAAQLRAVTGLLQPTGISRGCMAEERELCLMSCLAESVQLGAEGALVGVALMIPTTFFAHSPREHATVARATLTNAVALVTSFGFFACFAAAVTIARTT